ncbi:MAG: hypothetical protein JO087_03710, partial [Actinobacteria bacterium]|nr:hypothetical protein [Actinomycetota bacterium]
MGQRWMRLAVAGAVIAAPLTLAGTPSAFAAPAITPGDVFITEVSFSVGTQEHQVIEVPADGSGQIVYCNYPDCHAPEGIAVDASENVFLADTGNNQISEIAAGGGTPAPVTGAAAV